MNRPAFMTVSLVIFLAGCSRKPELPSVLRIPFQGTEPLQYATLTFSGPERSLDLATGLGTHDFGTNYSLVLDTRFVGAAILINGRNIVYLKHPDGDDAIQILVDGQPAPLPKTFSVLAQSDARVSVKKEDS